MIIAASNFKLLFSRKQPPYLFQRFRWNDQITRWCICRINWDIHLCQSMSVGGNHTHFIGPELPQHTIQDRPAFLRRHGKRSMRYELLQISRSDPPALIKPHGWKCRKLVPWKTKKLEAGAAALNRNSLLSNCTDLYGSWWQLSGNLTQLFGGNPHGNRNIHIRHYLRAD